MKTRDEVIGILRDLKAETAPLFDVRRFCLFESYARNEQSEQSAIDLLVELDRPVPFSAFCRLEDLISQRLGVAVDMTTSDGLHPRIIRRVLAEAVDV
jgi:predicted nucleotidyltransferase